MRLAYTIIAVIFLVASLVMVQVGTITYEQALQGAPIWASVIFGLYNWRSKIEAIKQSEATIEMLSNRVDRLTTREEKLKQDVWKLKSHLRKLVNTKKSE